MTTNPLILILSILSLGAMTLQAHPPDEDECDVEMAVLSGGVQGTDDVSDTAEAPLMFERSCFSFRESLDPRSWSKRTVYKIVGGVSVCFVVWGLYEFGSWLTSLQNPNHEAMRERSIDSYCTQSNDTLQDLVLRCCQHFYDNFLGKEVPWVIKTVKESKDRDFQFIGVGDPGPSYNTLSEDEVGAVFLRNPREFCRPDGGT